MQTNIWCAMVCHYFNEGICGKKKNLSRFCLCRFRGIFRHSILQDFGGFYAVPPIRCSTVPPFYCSTIRYFKILGHLGQNRNIKSLCLHDSKELFFFRLSPLIAPARYSYSANPFAKTHNLKLRKYYFSSQGELKIIHQSY